MHNIVANEVTEEFIDVSVAVISLSVVSCTLYYTILPALFITRSHSGTTESHHFTVRICNITQQRRG